MILTIVALLLWGVALGLALGVVISYVETGHLWSDMAREYIFVLEQADCREMLSFAYEHDLGYMKDYAVKNCMEMLI